MSDTKATFEDAGKKWLWKKGVSGNPKGRPKKGKTFPDLLQKELARITEEVEVDGQTKVLSGKELLCRGLVSMALKSPDDHIRLQAIDRIFDRMEGKPMQNLLMDANAKVEGMSVFDRIDVSKLNAQEKKNLEEILAKID